MYQSIHFEKGRLLVDQTDYLRKHDILYKSPAYKGYEGLPIGDGDMGCMLFNTERSMEITINKSDAIGFIDGEAFNPWAFEAEEKNTAQASCGRLSITDGMPSFDWLYLKDFEQRLNLSGAYVDWHAVTDFSEWNTRSYASKKDKVLVIEAKASSAESVSRRIALERWGSRNFFHYFEQLSKGTEEKLQGTASGELNGFVYIKQNLGGTSFVTCAKLITENEYIINRNSSRSMEYLLGSSHNAEFKLMLTVVCGSSEDDLVEIAVRRLEDAVDKREDLFNSHRECWKKFWERSFIKLSNDYLENIYYFNIYQLNSSCTGKYPPTFGGPWTWYGDTRNWGHYYHWNHQQTYWGVHGSGHPELAENYYEFKYSMLPEAQKDAKKIYEKNGAVFSDICNYNGHQAFEPDTFYNYSVGPQIAMDFYRHYKYTCDLDFLKTKAYPLMKACGNFYCGLLEESDGVYHIRGGASPYESFWNLKDTITDWSMIRILLSSLIEASETLNIDGECIPIWHGILQKLYDMPTIQHDGDIKIISAGVKWDGAPVLHNEGAYPLSPFPACQLSPIFPSGVIGLKDYGTEAFEIAVNTAKIIFNNDVYKKSGMGCSGHAPCPEAAARLGLQEDTKKLLELYVEKYQRFPCGFTHYSDMEDGHFSKKFFPRILEGREKSTPWEALHEKDVGNRIVCSSERFLHMYYEAAANIMAGVNEMLLQSHDGVIRVFPAVPDNDSAIFTLLAWGNFTVTSEKKGQDIRYIHILSNSGGTCRVYLPWKDPIDIYKNDTRSDEFTLEGNIIIFDTLKGDSILIQRSKFPLCSYYREQILSQVNNNVKKFRSVILGIERDF